MFITKLIYVSGIINFAKWNYPFSRFSIINTATFSFSFLNIIKFSSKLSATISKIYITIMQFTYYVIFTRKNLAKSINKYVFIV